MSSNPVWVTAAVGLALFAGAVPRGGRDSEARVDVVRHEAERRVDILIDGKPFTAYRYGDASVKKPILYPLRSARGTVVTRGFPLDPRAGERADHPHQVGHWFNHGEVNGFDFWGHSDATPPDLRAKAGASCTPACCARMAGPRPAGSSSPPTGSCRTARSCWKRRVSSRSAAAPTGAPSIARRPGPPSGGRSSSVIRKKAPSAFAWRGRSSTPRTSAICSWIQQAASRRRRGWTPHPCPGSTLGSDGKTGDAVWGTRAPWMALTGTLEGETVTIAVFDHPKNPGHPTSWHARGYGLFAANPFGQQGFDPKRPRTPTTLPAGAAFTFRHRILVRTGRLTHDGLQQEHQRFLAAQS